MYNSLHLVNDHSKCELTYSDSQKYLSNNTVLLKRIANYIWAYRIIRGLIPQTVPNFGSGHYFPYIESFFELETSYELALQGFYRHSLITLRLVLELGLLGFYFSVDDNKHTEVQPWITSKKPTPRRNDIFKKLSQIPNFQSFNKKFLLKKRIDETFNTLDKYTHTRGYKFSARKLQNHLIFNTFSAQSLQQYCDSMFSVVNNLIVVSLIKYPIGMQGLPMDEKFGLAGPVSGFLQEHDVDFIKTFLKPKERDMLQGFSDNSTEVQEFLNYIHDLPDLTEEEWKTQLDEWDKFNEEQGSIDTLVD